jgi:hypothetical protein
MIGKRMKFLLLEAAKCYDESYSPFNDEWLSRHNVTLDECMDLSIMIGSIVRGVVLSDENTQVAVLVTSAVSHVGKATGGVAG